MPDFTIVPQGAFCLRESVEFGFGQRHSERFDGVMRLAFVCDDLQSSVGVAVTQDDDGVHGEVTCAPGKDVTLATVRNQVSRILSLDQDATGYERVGERDPIVARLLEVAPGLRPPLFHSPYEAALWSIVSARRPAAQMMAVRDQLSREHGTIFEVAGREIAAAPLPERLRDVGETAGLTTDKVSRLHALADAAMGGVVDIGRLQLLGPEAAMRDLQILPGIGPFYAALIVIRACGFTDVLPSEEPRLRSSVARAYGLGPTCTAGQLAAVADSWRPFRTWVSVLFRAATDRLGDLEEAYPA